jgi:hypothetical protein
MHARPAADTGAAATDSQFGDLEEVPVRHHDIAGAEGDVHPVDVGILELFSIVTAATVVALLRVSSCVESSKHFGCLPWSLLKWRSETCGLGESNLLELNRVRVYTVGFVWVARLFT